MVAVEVVPPLPAAGQPAELCLTFLGFFPDVVVLILFAPGAPREDYFETLADAARREGMDDEQRAEFFLGHDTFWL